MDFTDFVILLGILPISLYYLLRNKVIEELHFLLPFLWVVLIGSLYEYFITGMLHADTKYWFWGNKILNFFSINYFFYGISDKRYKHVYRYSNIVFVLFFIMLLLLYRHAPSALKANSYLLVLQTIAVYLYSGLWFFKLFQDVKVTSLIHYPVFYVVSGIIIYHSGVIVLYLLSDTILKHQRELFLDYWMLIVYLNLFFRTLLIFAIWRGQTKYNTLFG